MGALAGLLRAAGHEVRGSDKPLYPPMSDQLAALQVPVFTGFSPSNLDWGPDAVVVGNVCKKDHPEVQEATRRELPLVSMPALLASEFIADKHSLVVAGTHGKTTTSSLLAEVLVSAGRDPGCFVGGVPIAFGRGWRYGCGPEFVVEGDEYGTAFFDKGSKFLHYRPRTVILTSVELDHVDIFASMEEVRETFRRLVRLIPEDGLLMVAASSAEALDISRRHAKCRIETYGVDRGDGTPVSADGHQPTWLASDLEYTRSGRCRFELWKNGELSDRYESLLVGAHNVANTTAVIAVAQSLGVDRTELRRGVAKFAGVKRRQEVRGIAQGVFVVDDYAHHPTAVAETLRGLRRRFEGRRILAIYEPRTATSRRKTFQREFANAFVHADALIVGRVYDQQSIPEDERFDPRQLAHDAHQAGTAATYIENVDDIVRHVVDEARPGDVVVVLSSGSFDGLHDKLLVALGDTIMPATERDRDEIRALLATTGLDGDRIDCGDHCSFLVLRNETGFVGCVALEVFGEEAILRSLAVKEGARGVGYGWMLADNAINLARLRGVRRIYLLTETASDFFAEKHGFRVVMPSTISADVADSATFRNCAPGAITMRLDL